MVRIMTSDFGIHSPRSPAERNVLEAQAQKARAAKGLTDEAGRLKSAISRRERALAAMASGRKGRKRQLGIIA